MKTDNKPTLDFRCYTVSPLRSILALAGGAAAVPLGVSPVDAAIIVETGLNGTVIGWNTGAGQTLTVDKTSLPGGRNGFRINTRATKSGGPSASSYVGVVVGWPGLQFRVGPGGGQYPAYLAEFGATVGKGIGFRHSVNVNLGLLYTSTTDGVINTSSSDKGNPAVSGSSKYLLFSFDNSGTTNYGWIELTATTTGFTGGKSAYSATLGDWAYDNSGAEITAGAVPEPASAALAMGGALLVGAAGLRRWRKQGAAQVASGEQA
jgi:hypothetical protein